jgi:hypothetical protein
MASKIQYVHIGGVVLTAVLQIWIRIQIRIQRIHVFLGLLDPDPDLDPSNIDRHWWRSV